MKNKKHEIGFFSGVFFFYPELYCVVVITSAQNVVKILCWCFVLFFVFFFYSALKFRTRQRFSFVFNRTHTDTHTHTHTKKKNRFVCCHPTNKRRTPTKIGEKRRAETAEPETQKKKMSKQIVKKKRSKPMGM